MAAVSYSAGKVEKINFAGEAQIVTWISPATMDSADTVVLPTVTGKSLALISCWDITAADAVTHTLSTATVTIDAAGGTTDHQYVLTFMYV
jgi:hypothetical protein